jgi:LmbE family N-acetylglucosaminyl deacetylase
MKSIASRMLAARPGEVFEHLEREGAVVITKDGVPRSIMVPTTDATFLEDVQDLVFARARRAVRAIRVHATQTGTDALTPAAIEREIKAARRARRRKTPRG